LHTGLIWTVCDVAEVAQQGTDLARERGETQLQFTTDLVEINDVDILLMAGTLQYMEIGFLAGVLRGLNQKPRHVLLQRNPLHNSRSFVTLKATGHAFCPYSVTHRQELLEDMARLG
jgi:putative methyltransferase (TIGR04325 family)